MAENSGESQRTTDHDTIREWAEERGGRPATVADTGSEDDPGVLRFDFEDGEARSASESRTESGDGDEDLGTISWDAFFEAFEENDLAMLYQEETSDGGESRFFKFVNREE